MSVFFTALAIGLGVTAFFAFVPTTDMGRGWTWQERLPRAIFSGVLIGLLALGEGYCGGGGGYDYDAPMPHDGYR